MSSRPIFRVGIFGLWLLVMGAVLAACGPQATVPPSPAPAPTSAARPSPSTVPPSPFTGIEQGKTAEGYQALGSASAPLTLVMYSDFL